VINCRHSGGEWSCVPGEEVLFAEVAGQKVEIGASGVSMRDALDIVRYLRSIDGWQADLRDLMHPEAPPHASCDVSARAGDVLIVACGAWKHAFRRVPGGYEKIADAGK
jgi:hypothetical protein